MELPPYREIRAVHDERSVTVYQAYSPSIANPALRAKTFVAPFRRERMTWIKPSFLWMMYRCGWATKPDQERVLAIDITRAGFEWALHRSSLSHFDPSIYDNYDAWIQRKQISPVRIQWDPERSLKLGPLPHRAIQVGLAGEAANRYVDEWILDIVDVTDQAHEIARLVTSGDLEAARHRLPTETPYPLPAELAAVIGASR